MITKEQAITSYEFHSGECVVFIGPRGGYKYQITRVRRNGRTKTWKTRPDEWTVPIKFGMYGYPRPITQAEAHMWHTAEDCKPTRKKMGTGKEAKK